VNRARDLRLRSWLPDENLSKAPTECLPAHTCTLPKQGLTFQSCSNAFQQHFIVERF
jgi:hypothetical protein